MLHKFNLGDYLGYPFENGESQKNFLIGWLVMLAGFFIPLLPFIILYGYISQVMEKVLNGERPSMPAWSNWEKLFKDGLRLYGVRMIFTLPSLILIFGMMVLYLGGVFLVFAQDQPSLALIAVLVALFFGVFCLMIPIGIITTVLAYPAGAHAVAKQRFAAGFSFGEWWPILRTNVGSFLLIIGVTWVISFATGILLQLLYITIILACLAPFIMPILMFYMLLVIEPMAAQSYRDGREKLNHPAN
jgi:hypothetical protein